MTTRTVSPATEWSQIGSDQYGPFGDTRLIVNPGTAAVWNAQLVFAGDGSLTNSTTGQVVTVAGSSGAVTVEVLTGSTTQGGVDADGLAVANTSQIMRFEPGTNNVTAAGTTVTVKWRPGYK